MGPSPAWRLRRRPRRCAKLGLASVFWSALHYIDGTVTGDLAMMDLDDPRTFVEVVEGRGDQQGRAAAWRGEVPR
jgi:hypothetical protein